MLSISINGDPVLMIGGVGLAHLLVHETAAGPLTLIVFAVEQVAEMKLVPTNKRMIPIAKHFLFM
jgi:hypothetical protein